MALKERLQESNLIRWTAGNRWYFACIVGAIGMFSLLPFLFMPAVRSNPKILIPLLLFPLPFVLGFGLMATGVGKKMTKVRNRVAPGATLQSDCLMVRDMIECPGIAQIIDEGLVLTPMLGKPLRVSLNTHQFKEKRGRFNGTLYPGNTAFWITGPDVKWRLGFAVPNGEQWLNYFPNLEHPD